MITKIRRCALPLAAVLFLAAAPAPVKTQVPGYYRMALGSFEVTALYDGSLRISPKILHGGADPAPLLAREFSDTNAEGVLTAINAYLVNTGDHLVLVDAGERACGPETVGHMLENLKASGYKPEEVDAVLITHMHGDHVCGLTDNGARVFPNATVYAAEQEAAFWLTVPKKKNPNDAFEAYKDKIRHVLAPYQAAKALKTFKPGAVLFPGVTALDTRGHTPGHESYLFESGGKSFVAIGDTIHVGAVQFSRPEVSIDYDTDQPAAVAQRKALFKTLAEKGWVFGGSHLPFPGIGHVRAEGDAFAYVPVEYAPLP